MKIQSPWQRGLSFRRPILVGNSSLNVSTLKWCVNVSKLKWCVNVSKLKWCGGNSKDVQVNVLRLSLVTGRICKPHSQAGTAEKEKYTGAMTDVFANSITGC